MVFTELGTILQITSDGIKGGHYLSQLMLMALIMVNFEKGWNLTHQKFRAKPVNQYMTVIFGFSGLQVFKWIKIIS